MDMEELLSTGEFSDVTVTVGHRQFHLHRFPLMASSTYFRDALQGDTSTTAQLALHGLPGGCSAMELVADFCYGLPVDQKLSPTNIGHVICAASVLQMSGSRNLLDVCKLKLSKFILENTTKCLAILANCADNCPILEKEGVTQQCIEGAVDHLAEANKELQKGMPLQSYVVPSSHDENWLSYTKRLPLSWMFLFLEELQRRDCRQALVVSSAAAYIDAVIDSYNSSQLLRFRPSDHDQHPALGMGTTLSLLQIHPAAEYSGPEVHGELQDQGQNSKKSTGCQLQEERAEERVPKESKQQHDPRNMFPMSLDSHMAPISSDTDAELLLWAFEALIAYITDNAPILDALKPGWFARALCFASEHDLHSTSHLVAICSFMYNQLALEDVQELDPAVFQKLNTEAGALCFPEAVEQLTDDYLKHRAARRRITASEFSGLLNSTAWCERKCHDQAFVALETLLEACPTLNSLEAQKAIDAVDFTKLSQAALERAAENNRIPVEVTLKAAVIVCRQLRQRLEKLDYTTTEPLNGLWSLVDTPGGLKMEINTNSKEGSVFPLDVCLLHPQSRKPERVEFITSKAVFMPLTPKRKKPDTMTRSWNSYSGWFGNRFEMTRASSRPDIEWTAFDICARDRPSFFVYDPSSKTLYDPVPQIRPGKALMLRRWKRTRRFKWDVV